MRLFEATGCGALTLTENFKNLPDLFRGSEVVNYDGVKDVVAKVAHYLDLEHDFEVQTIAERGQKRTLKDHTYDKRMEFVAEILEGML